ncbi:head-tail adaptor protein [Lederbergia sp. NSJ-179]|uniref:phage head completion protein n=1 Tax=Lederbergia sp. NSJ-179 TaxID=2931402 RepID=UPI001FCFA723|nr:head-tail adaptor protein [Lederbergia sp. NSJ-179]MCJ7839978.1 head-tail adaptor protein [Lederbergia sp. NSJ-179]
MQSFEIQEEKSIPDGIGGHIKDWFPVTSVEGYLDLVTGTNLNPVQNAFIEESTHLLIIPEFTPAITDDMRIVDQHNRFYLVTYADDPVGVGHHNEIYCKYGGVIDGKG